MDSEKLIFFLKCFAALLAIILFFTVVLPKYKQVNEFIDTKVEEFLGLIFQTTVTIGKKTDSFAKSYTEAELEGAITSFELKFMTINTKMELESLIRAGEAILLTIPMDINIRQKAGFLYYMNGELEKALEQYEFVLENVPKGKRSLKKLRAEEDHKSVKRTLLELAAVYYDLGNKEKMMDYYKQFLRVAFRDELYREYISEGMNEENVRYGIFSNFGGVGFFSYKKSIDELEAILKTSPDNKGAVDILGKNCFEVVNLFFDNPPFYYIDYLEKADKYLNLTLESASEFRKQSINKDLLQLQKLRNKYFAAKQSDLKDNQY